MSHQKQAVSTRNISMRAPAARNPWVAPSLFRRAGAHRPTGGAERQRAARSLRRELAQALSP